MTIKYLKLLSLIFFCGNALHGQYIPLVEEGKFWIYQNHEQADMPSPIGGHAITFAGDTTINSLLYKRVYKINLKGGHNCPVTDMPCWEFDYPYQAESQEIVSFIREDIPSKKIYNLPVLNNNFCETEEYLLFDYSLNLGDTLNDCIYQTIWASDANFLPGGIVDSLKVVESYGQLRNTIFTYGFNILLGLPFELVIPIAEGVGFTDFGIFYKTQSVMVDFCENGIAPCNLILSNKYIPSKREFKIFPNPSNGIFQISIEPENIKSIRVYSILGRLEKEVEVSSSLNLSNLEKGVYLLEIITKKEERIIKKIIKENN